MVKSNLKEEERLAEEIRKFLSLYDKSNERFIPSVAFVIKAKEFSYFRKRLEKNAWCEVENALDYEDGTY